MPSFGSKSQSHLITCHPDLRLLFNTVIGKRDCSILEGRRTQQRQNYLYSIGATTVLKSNHVPDNPDDLSNAVDVVPWPIDWTFEKEALKAAEIGDKKALKAALHSIQRWAIFVGYVQAVADTLELRIRWGGDWDGDLDLRDQNFDDWPHWEVI